MALSPFAMGPSTVNRKIVDIGQRLDRLTCGKPHSVIRQPVGDAETGLEPSAKRNDMRRGIDRANHRFAMDAARPEPRPAFDNRRIPQGWHGFARGGDQGVEAMVRRRRILELILRGRADGDTSAFMGDYVKPVIEDDRR